MWTTIGANDPEDAPDLPPAPPPGYERQEASVGWGQSGQDALKTRSCSAAMRCGRMIGDRVRERAVCRCESVEGAG